MAGKHCQRIRSGPPGDPWVGKHAGTYSVILLWKGKEIVVFVGPGGYNIEWSPGTKLLPMIPAPSGHLVTPCDKFDEVGTTTTKDQVTFLTDHTKGYISK